MDKLNVLIWNVQDLFIFLDKHKDEDLTTIGEPAWQLLSTSLKANKEHSKVTQLADVILGNNYDICLLTEVGGEESLSNFNKYFLGEQFSVIHYPTNSERGIDLGILVKKDLVSKTKHKFHNHKVFARGALQFELKLDDKNHYRFFLTHLKSKLSKALDFEGRTQRNSEVVKLCEIYEKEQNKNEIPTFICGDFNGIIRGEDTEAELSHFENSQGLVDIFEHLNRDTFERGTYSFFDKHGNLNLMQLDYAVCEKKWAHLIDPQSAVIDFEGQNRVNIEVSRAQRLLSPSDHYPISLILKLI